MTATLYIGNKNYSSWSLRPWLVMRHAGMDFRDEKLALLSDDYRARIPGISPSGKVPVLHLDDQVIWDSLAICEFIAETYPDAQCWPTAREARAQARAVVAEMHSGFPALRNLMPMDCRKLLAPVKVQQPQELAKDIQRIHAIWQECLAKSGGPFLFGSFSIVDAFFAPVVIRFKSYGVHLDATLEGYCQTLLQLPDMQAWIEEGQGEKEMLNYTVITLP